MKEVYNEKYYTLNLIPQERQVCITLALVWLTDLLGLKDRDWPVDGMKLLELLKASPRIAFKYMFADMKDECDGVADYSHELDQYVIVLNQNKKNYPYKTSQDRRLNFTIAHELGHIALGHVLSTAKKTKEQEDYENLEADEFAGRFLLPEALLFSCNYYSIASAAEYLIVSETALWKRLNNMKRLDLFHSRRVNTCQKCGNTSFSVFAEYCGICGTPLKEGLKGIRRVFYHSHIKMDRYKRVLECPVCHSKHFNTDKCSRCSTYIFNYCDQYFVSGDDICGFSNPAASRFCEMCGKPTYFYRRGLISHWEEEANAEASYISGTI
jgi:ribosomal protein L37E